MKKFSIYIILFFKILLLFFVTNLSRSSASNPDFQSWLIEYKKYALSKGVSQNTINVVLKDVKYLDQVIKYDRKQPEFFEDTLTYVSKRATTSRAKKANKLFKMNINLIYEIEKKFLVEKEILLALWGIETNFGKHVGKMPIIDSLATLSFDQRRSKYFSSQLIILLKLIDEKVIDHETLYGSWAGAYGNFQFMPSTIKSYAIDYDKNNKIELKTSVKDSFASAANYIKKIGWKHNEPCFYRVKLNKEMNKKYINTSAKKLYNKLSVLKWKKMGVVSFYGKEINDNLKAALILPDSSFDGPSYLVFDNYEKILKWNRSLRFGISVCTLANMIKNE